MSGVDIYGKDGKMPTGVTYLQVATTTWQEMVEEWDTTTCQGGVWWSRDRENPKTANYKSTISNSEFMALGARLTLASGNKTYMDWSDRTYKWLKTMGLVTPTFHVLDGATAPTCTGAAVDQSEWMFNSALMFYALAYMHKASGNDAYLTDAAAILRVMVSTWASGNNSTSNIVGLADKCEASGSCARDNPAGKGQTAKSLGILYMETKDETVKGLIKSVVETSVKNMVAACDADWWCPHTWTAGAKPAHDVYNQYPAVELLNAAVAIYGGTVPNVTPPAGGSSGQGSSTGSNGVERVGMKGWSVAGIVGAMVIVVGCLF
ncbi:hydrolase 76 protein [Borealophlyctis nickersoniae]|nr:hydrolase 76 protein [Borealophlyctis nickersoniae]